MHHLERQCLTARRTGKCADRCAHVASPRTVGLALALVVVTGCTEAFDAGSSPPHGQLPVDERNPIVLINDSNYDNWHGEYAALLANSGGPSLAGIIVGTSPNATDIDANVADWRNLVAAARASGLANIPDPIASIGAPLQRPASGDIDATVPNRSEGALFIVSESARRSLPYRPLVVQTAGRLTDVADAYLVDPTVVARVVIVSSLGTLSASGAVMGRPNGEMDPWADTIVTARFRYVQISAYYDQLTDVPAARVSELPANAFGSWIAAKQPGIWSIPQAADQGGVAALGIPGFVVAVERVSAVGPIAAGASAGPDLAPSPEPTAWLVTQVAGATATNRFWQLLLDPATFAH
jgi:hypothetical protein